MPLTLQPGMPPDDLRRWADENAVTSWLDAPARSLQGDLRGAWYWLYRNSTVGELVSAPTAARTIDASLAAIPADLQQAAIRLLQEQAALAAEALAEEAAHQASLCPPLEHRLRPLWERLELERDRLRPHVHPRPSRHVGPYELTLSEDPPRLRYREQSTGWCGGGRWPVVDVDLQASDDSPMLACRCPGGASARCAVGLSALDACLGLLSESENQALRRDLVRLMATPRWSRLLESLDRVLARPEAQPDESLGWRLKDAPDKPLSVEPVRCKRRKGEGLNTWKLPLDELARNPHLATRPQDAAALEWLQPVPGLPLRPTDPLHQALVHRAVAALAGHPLVLLERGQVLAVRRATLALRLQHLDDGRLRLTPTIDDAPLAPRALLDLLHQRMAGGWLVRIDAALGLCQVVAVAPRIVGLLDALLLRGDTLPADALPELQRRFEALSHLLPLRLDGECLGQDRPADARPLLRLEVEDGEILRIEARSCPLEGQGDWPFGEGPRELYGQEDGEPFFVRRDLAGEPAAARAALAALELPAESAPFTWRLADPDAAGALLARLQEEGWRATWEGAPRRVLSATAADLRLSISSSNAKRDWFGVDGALDVGGARVTLAVLAEAVRQGRSFVQAEDGAFIRLEPAFREQLAAVAEALAPGRGGGPLGIASLHAPLLAPLAEAAGEADLPARWTRLLAQVSSAQSAPVDLPAGLNLDLRAYQREGYAWMARLAAWGVGACLADDMGLGKTAQALALLLRRRAEGPALVVAPTSLCFNWQGEAARFAPGLKPRIYQGSKRAALLEGLGPGDLLITSYTLLLRDQDALAALSFSTVVFDEAQALKNPRANRTAAARRLQAGFRLALTGTPIENRTAELWSLFSVITPGLLGSWERFRERFVTPVEAAQEERRRVALSRLIRPFLLRRLKAEVAPQLPPRTEIVVSVPLSGAERRLYDQARAASLTALLQASTEEQRRFQALAAITRLRQLACHPRLHDPDSPVPSAKLARLREIAAQLHQEGHRALVFSQFTRHLALARDALQEDGLKCRYLDGATPPARRQQEVDAFQAGSGDVFLISLKAGGTGLNLTAATYVLHLDPWWNPAVEAQAADRAHRIGQDQPVTIYRLIAQGTIEESILDLHAEKRQLIDAILAGTAGAASLDADALTALIQRSGAAWEKEGEE